MPLYRNHSQHSASQRPASQDLKRSDQPESIQDILQHPKVWRARFLAKKNTRSQAMQGIIPTGFAALDQHLSGGWPAGQLIELNYGTTGIGELSLILPALTHISTHYPQPLAWIHPTHTTIAHPNPHMLTAQGMDPQKLLWITPASIADALWAAEQCLNSAGCSVTCLWLPAQTRSTHLYRALQRLQIAAQRTNNWGMVLRAGEANPQALGHAPAPLRLHLKAAQNALRIQIVKRPQGWPMQPFSIVLPTQKTLSQRFWHWQHLDWNTKKQDTRAGLPLKRAITAHESVQNEGSISPQHR